MSHWQIGTCKKLEPLLKLIKGHVITGNIANMDETPMRVMDEPGRKNKQESRMWLIKGGPPGQKAVWYEYRETREAKHIIELLNGYRGFLQTDDYTGYESALKSLPGIIHVGCWAHVRRKFYDAKEIAKKSEDASAALSQIKGLYTVEERLRKQVANKEIDEMDFLDKRAEKCEPILNAFHEWLLAREGKILESSKLGESISYTLKIWPTLVRYLDNAELTPDNNAAERGIRPFVMGRKNWVMSGSPAGAKSSCELYSLIETAKENRLNPYDYLRAIITKAAYMTVDDDWSQLLPWNIDLSFLQGGKN
jgi:hypothetical protein